jgi:hypothetical protein
MNFSKKEDTATKKPVFYNNHQVKSKVIPPTNFVSLIKIYLSLFVHCNL